MKLTKKKIRELIDDPENWWSDSVTEYLDVVRFKYYPICRIYGRMKLMYPEPMYKFIPLTREYFMLKYDDERTYIEGYNLTSVIEELYQDRDNIDYDE